MESINFLSYIKNTFGVDGTAAVSCQDLTKLKELNKGQILARSGEICKDLYFVERGLLRQYFVDRNGKEHILYFAPENWILGDRTSLYFNEPSDYIIEAIEEAVVVVLKSDFFIHLGEIHPDAISSNDLLLQRHIRQLQKRVSLLLGASAEERYLDFITTYPNMMQRVPQWMIASYLGITPESLSRVRRELAKKNFLID